MVSLAHIEASDGVGRATRFVEEEHPTRRESLHDGREEGSRIMVGQKHENPLEEREVDGGGQVGRLARVGRQMGHVVNVHGRAASHAACAERRDKLDRCELPHLGGDRRRDATAASAELEPNLIRLALVGRRGAHRLIDNGATRRTKRCGLCHGCIEDTHHKGHLEHTHAQCMIIRGKGRRP